MQHAAAEAFNKVLWRRHVLMQALGKAAKGTQLVGFKRVPAKDIGLVEPNDSTILPGIDRGERFGKGIEALERLGLVKVTTPLCSITSTK